MTQTQTNVGMYGRESQVIANVTDADAIADAALLDYLTEHAIEKATDDFHAVKPVQPNFRVDVSGGYRHLHQPERLTR